jgi:UDP-N-acetylmuramoyl-tripeptide--D-alanyl-D-alanine ligase
MNGDFLRPAIMMSLDDVAHATGGTLRGSRVAISGVTTDSRRVSAGDLFVALTGERFDGHGFVEEAMRRGAVAALVSRPVQGALPIPQVMVDDTRLGLGRLAASWRRRFALPLVALTGSNGKTTVKEMVAAILAAYCGSRDPVLATEGNLNNDIGMPLTLLGLRGRHRFAVIEMGMNHEGEIDYLTRLAAPTVALVNNAHRAHVGLLGDVEAVARAKGEIYAGLDAGGIALVNADDPFAGYWRGLNEGRRVISFGLSDDADVHARSEGGATRFVTPVGEFSQALRVAGEHNLRNAAAACAVAHALGVPLASMQGGLSSFGGVPGRLQLRAGVKGSTLIDDTYNANPESMKAAIAVLAEAAGRRLLVMGDMGELGEGAAAMHAEVGAYAASRGIDALLALGPLGAQAAGAFGPNGACFDSLEALVEAAQAQAGPRVTLLVKGSRFMQMERVVAALAAPGGANAA